VTATDQLSLIGPSGPRHQAAAGEARLLVFNAQHAAPGRARRQAEWIAAQEAADLVVISEAGSGPGGAALTGALTAGAYTSVLAPGASFAGYGTVLASRSIGLTAIPSDAYRALHPDAPGHSWFGRSGQGYRFDHAFVTAPHAGLIRSCRYLQEPRELSITDHAP
jgi:hypothetical protein